jgi:3-isopropylmalate/(R)-2-methylmalate dehydratase large subunit
MPRTIIEKIIGAHAGRDVAPGDMVDMVVDTRVARDFGGANVVRHLEANGLPIHDPARTFFTFDCNPGGSDQSYASNQHACRLFARRHGIRVFDIDAGIGTHLAIEEGLVGPGGTFVSTDSHANILGAIGAFGQGMGDQDIAHVFAYGTTWFIVPPTVRINLTGMPTPAATPKDVTLFMTRHFGANGLLGVAAELHGDYIDALDLAGRITIASMGTEMGAVTLLIPPDPAILDYCAGVRGRGGRELDPHPIRAVHPDPGAAYQREITLDLSGLEPQVARPGHPEDVVPAAEASGARVDSVFIGSCTNGRYEDFVVAARVLEGRRVAPGVVLKVVPATDAVWRRLLDDGLLQVFKDAGALVSNAGCAGCAAGQVGQNGPGEVTVSTGNRNFAGKQGKGEVWLASPETAAASAVAGVLTDLAGLRAGASRTDPAGPVPVTEEPAPGDAAPSGSLVSIAATRHAIAEPAAGPAADPAADEGGTGAARPTVVAGRAWVIPVDNIDTDMIFHNRYLTITDPALMGRYAFDNLAGWEDFADRARPGDIVVVGANFGCGSSRQQAVDCFLALGIAALVADSFGAIYERNAINAGLAILQAPGAAAALDDGEEVTIDFAAGTVARADGSALTGRPFSDAQMRIYRRGGLLVPA